MCAMEAIVQCVNDSHKLEICSRAIMAIIAIIAIIATVSMLL